MHGARRLPLLLGLALVLGAGFLPHHEPRAVPGRSLPPSASFASERPAELLATAVARGLERGRMGERLWEIRRWYPYALAPLWVAALLVAWARPRARRGVGAFLVLLTFAVAVLEARYLIVEYAPLFPDTLGRGEVALAWLLVVAVLAWRRRADRHVGAVEAHVAALALLSALHFLTLPATQARCWLDRHALVDVAGAVCQNFLPAFWTGFAGLLLVALPTYVRRTTATERGAVEPATPDRAASQPAAPPPSPAPPSS